MPADLWEAAVALARRHGLYAVARGLPVDYGSLKKRVDRVSSRERDVMAVPAGFVEVEASQFLAVPKPAPEGAIVELTAGDGAKLTIRLAPGEVVDVAALAASFLGRGR